MLLMQDQKARNSCPQEGGKNNTQISGYGDGDK